MSATRRGGRFMSAVLAAIAVTGLIATNNGPAIAAADQQPVAKAATATSSPAPASSLSLMDKVGKDQQALRTVGFTTIVHTVKSGETLARIAERYGTSWEKLFADNKSVLSDPDEIYPGQKLQVKKATATTATVKVASTDPTPEGDAEDGADHDHDHGHDHSDDADTDDSEHADDPADEGSEDGDDSGDDNSDEETSEQPKPETPKPARNFVSPIAYKAPCTSPYAPRWGSFHKGYDLGVPTGTPVHAVTSGTVVSSKYIGDYGNVIVVKGAYGIFYEYGHLSVRHKSVGEHVDVNEVIAKSGATGYGITGAHLHFAVAKALYAKRFNPASVLRPNGIRLC